MSTSSPYHLLLHHQLLKALRQKPPAWRAELQRTLEQLQLGYWGGGTRVKLLHGASKVVYEARVNLSLRLLFTVARGYLTTPPYEPSPFILVWDVVDHDHLDHVHRRNLQPEAGFLDFVECASYTLPDDTPPPTPERATAQAPREAAAFRTWMQGAAPVPTGDELTESIRWFALDPEVVLAPEQWQALFDDPTREDLELKLSREQAETVFAAGPVLLKGTAGSGKTTVTVYRLARARCTSSRARACST